LLQLKLSSGNIPTARAEVDVPHLQPGEDGTISVEFVSPSQPGKCGFKNVGPRETDKVFVEFGIYL